LFIKISLFPKACLGQINSGDIQSRPSLRDDERPFGQWAMEMQCPSIYLSAGVARNPTFALITHIMERNYIKTLSIEYRRLTIDNS